MAQTIGMAGRVYGNGRVAALTKAVNLENLHSINEDYFVRLLLNSALWATKSVGNNPGDACILRTDNEDFDNKLKDIFAAAGFTVTMTYPWWTESGNIPANRGLYVIAPSYNAFDGVRMSDFNQERILYEVEVDGAGLLITEWFHLLQSIPTKRSFSLTTDVNKGLISASPFSLQNNFIVFTDADEIKYTSLVEDDSMSFAIPETFTLSNSALDTPFSGHISQIGSIKEDAVIYWGTDINSDDDVTVIQTSTTTPEPIYEDFRLKVFELNLLNACGPQKLYLTGDQSDMFSLEGNDIYLLKKVLDPQTVTINIVAEDYFENKRFNTIVETVDVDFINCTAPISLPIDGSYPAYSYRENDGQILTKAWGRYAPYGVISPYNDWSFIGRGTQEEPAIGCLGGKHNDVNTIWMQINDGGEVSAKIITDLETWKFDTGHAWYDFAKLYLVQNPIEPENSLLPYQHSEEMVNFSQYPAATIAHNFNWFSGRNYIGGKTEYSFSFNVENPNAANEDGDLIRGSAFAVLVLEKSLTRSESEDKVCVELVLGTTTTTPAPDEEFVVFIQLCDQLSVGSARRNSCEGETITAIKFTSPPGDDILENVQAVYVCPPQDRGLGQITATDDSDFVTTDLVGNRVDITLNEMPVGGGFATVIVCAPVSPTTTTTTTTTKPPYKLTIRFIDNIDNTRLTTYEKEWMLGAGTHYLPYAFTYITEDCCEYRLDDVPTGNGPGSIIPPYTYYDRPTVTEIVSSTVPNIVRLASPKPNDVVELQDISVNRGTRNTGESTVLTRGEINIPVEMPPFNAEVVLRLGTNDHDHNEPDLTTTPAPPVTTPPPCDDTIYIICQQVLECLPDSDGVCQPTSNSYQQIVYSTCCELNESEVMTLVRQKNNSSSQNSTLFEMYGSQCTVSDFEFLGDCLPQSISGQCQETIHNKIIDVVSCPASENPLP